MSFLLSEWQNKVCSFLIYIITWYFSGLILYLVEGGQVYHWPPCLSCMVRPRPCLLKSVQPATCWCSIYSSCVVLFCQSNYICGLFQGVSCAGFGVNLVRLSEQVDPNVIFPLQALHADGMCFHPCPPLLYVIVIWNIRKKERRIKQLMLG